MVPSDSIDSGHERLEAQERTVEGCAGSGRRICYAVVDFFRYRWQPIVVATVISRNIWNGSYHLIHPAITRVLRAFGIDKWSYCKRLAWKISQKEDPNWAPIFLGCNKLPWCNLEIVRRRQCCKAAWIQVLSAPATRPAAIGYARQLVGFGRKRYAETSMFFFFMFACFCLMCCVNALSRFCIAQLWNGGNDLNTAFTSTCGFQGTNFAWQEVHCKGTQQRGQLIDDVFFPWSSKVNPIQVRRVGNLFFNEMLWWLLVPKSFKI